MGKLIEFYPDRKTILNVVIKTYPIDSNNLITLSLFTEKQLHELWKKHINDKIPGKRDMVRGVNEK